MATYQSSLVTDGVVYDEVGVKVRKATYAVTAAIAGGVNVLEMIPVYKGEMLVDLKAEYDDLDSNGTPAIDATVGDGGDVDRFISTSTTPQAGGLVGIEHNVGHVFTADDTIDVDISTAAATGQAGNITVVATLI